jgi:2-methylcitrate dehydratase PrpD
MLAHRRLDVTSFTPDAIAAPEVLELTPRVTYELRQYSPTPDSFGGGVRVETTDGRTFEAELRYQRGSAQHPLSDCDIIDKYRANAALAFPSSLVAELEAAVLDLEGRPDTTWAGLLGKAGS